MSFVPIRHDEGGRTHREAAVVGYGETVGEQARSIYISRTGYTASHTCKKPKKERKKKWAKYAIIKAQSS